MEGGDQENLQKYPQSRVDHLQETLLTFELGDLLPKGQHTGLTKHGIAV